MGRSHHNRLVNDIVERELRRAGATYLRGRLLDIGCGRKPYRQLLGPYVDEHVGLDHAESQHSLEEVDLIGSAYAIPADDAAFDSVICTAVLEHLEEPYDALAECLRVLRSGAYAIYTAPFIWHIHEEPRDFYRYSEFGLRYLFEKAGFDIVELKALSGFWVTGGQMLAYYVNRLNRGWLKRTRLVDLWVSTIQTAASLLEQFDRPEKWTWMYLVVARKP
jgi:SAM-dependent methyltransferase